MQMLHWTYQGCCSLNLLFTNKEELSGDVIIDGNFGCNDHVTAGFTVLRGLMRARGIRQASAGFSLLRELVGGML